MAAVDLTAPATLPFISRPTLATTATQINLPTNHGTLLVTVTINGAAGSISFDPSGTDGGTQPSAKEALLQDVHYTYTIPPTSMGGVTKFFVAAAAGTPTASIQVTRYTLT